MIFVCSFFFLFFTFLIWPSRSTHSFIDEARSLDRIMPLPRTKKPLLSSAPSITAINQFASGNTSNNNNNNNHINNGISNPPSAVSFAPTTSSSTMITNNTTCNASGAPLPPPRRAASQQRFVQKNINLFLVKVVCTDSLN